MIGPNVTQAIIDKTGNNWKGFPFLFTLCTSASLIIWFGVDVTEGRYAAIRWAEEKRGRKKSNLRPEGLNDRPSNNSTV